MHEHEPKNSFETIKRIISLHYKSIVMHDYTTRHCEFLSLVDDYRFMCSNCPYDPTDEGDCFLITRPLLFLQ